MQFLLCFIDSLSVLAVDDENKPLSACVIMSPQRSDLVLASDIPDIKLHILVGDGLHVEAN